MSAVLPYVDGVALVVALVLGGIALAAGVRLRALGAL